MSIGTMLRFYADQADATATRTGRADARRVAAILRTLAAKHLRSALVAAEQKRRQRSRQLGAGHAAADSAELRDLAAQLEAMSGQAATDSGASKSFAGSGPQTRRVLRRIS